MQESEGLKFLSHWLKRYEQYLQMNTRIFTFNSGAWNLLNGKCALCVFYSVWALQPTSMFKCFLANIHLLMNASGAGWGSGLCPKYWTWELQTGWTDLLRWPVGCPEPQPHPFAQVFFRNISRYEFYWNILYLNHLSSWAWMLFSQQSSQG